MKINQMRIIDYWVGIPSCFILTLIERIRLIFFPSYISDDIVVKRILFIGLSEMGSAILSYSAVEKLKEFYPDAQISFLIFDKNKESAKLLNNIEAENILTIRSDSILRFSYETIKTILHLRKIKIDCAIDLELFSRFSTFLSYLSGAKIRVGFYPFNIHGLYRGELLTHKVNYNAMQHITKNFMSLILSLTIPNQLPYVKESMYNYEYSLPKYEPSPDIENALMEKLKARDFHLKPSHRLIVMNAGFINALPLRLWPHNNYASVAQMILRDENNVIVKVGVVGLGSTEENKGWHIDHPRCLDLTDDLSVDELITLFSISDALISHDCGLVHLAGLTDIHVIALFGPETPACYGPITKNKTVLYAQLSCSPCMTAYNNRTSPCKNNVCVQVIQPDQVFKAFNAAFEK